MFSRSTNDYYRRIIDDSRSVIDNSIVKLQLVGSFTIIIYDCHILIAKATRVVVVRHYYFKFLKLI